ncbi:hypothetical protein GCK72_021244 [Caenorhabditis remanei]|uniref:F-box domain-containing protein n=1 Tax=Caenorhabditis remanei TaxID=31234 RepID=A0A6A5GHL5_CAERE|nr:hypothetical protein GCK72_021244 [Caenorhabditis remanei]KAF1754680.1 hypothetical protein GCK72_021244 [Caenorhabditis remanei]
MRTAFPLLRLPYLVLMPVLEQMEITEKVSLSILSKRVRIYVKLLKMTCEHVNVILKNDRIEMKVFFENGEELRVLQYIDETQRSNFIYRHEHEMVFSWCPGSRLPVDYAVSIMDVTHCKSINQFIIAGIFEHDSIPIVTKLPKIDEVVVEHIWHPKFLTYEALRHKERILLRVLKTVLPVSSAVQVNYPFQILQNLNYLREILKGNLDAVTLKNYWG